MFYSLSLDLELSNLFVTYTKPELAKWWSWSGAKASWVCAATAGEICQSQLTSQVIISPSEMENTHLLVCTQSSRPKVRADFANSWEFDSFALNHRLVKPKLQPTNVICTVKVTSHTMPNANTDCVWLDAKNANRDSGHIIWMTGNSPLMVLPPHSHRKDFCGQWYLHDVGVITPLQLH